VFASPKPPTPRPNNPKKLRVFSGSKESHLPNKSLELRETTASILTNSGVLGSQRGGANKENCPLNDINEIKAKIKKNLEIFQSQNGPSHPSTPNNPTPKT
jgi:hypothetical protein